MTPGIGLATIAVAGWNRVFDDAKWPATLIEIGHTLDSPASVKESGPSADNQS
jgi:hypothetical protein